MHFVVVKHRRRPPFSPVIQWPVTFDPLECQGNENRSNGGEPCVCFYTKRKCKPTIFFKEGDPPQRRDLVKIIAVEDRIFCASCVFVCLHRQPLFLYVLCINWRAQTGKFYRYSKPVPTDGRVTAHCGSSAFARAYFAETKSPEKVV